MPQQHPNTTTPLQMPQHCHPIPANANALPATLRQQQQAQDKQCEQIKCCWPPPPIFALGGGQDFWCLCCPLSSPLKMVQTRVFVYNTETCFHVHANSLEMTQTRTYVFDTETCFRFNLLYSLELAHIKLLYPTRKLISLSDTEICFRVRHRNLFPLLLFCSLFIAHSLQQPGPDASWAKPAPLSPPQLLHHKPKYGWY